ncbi:hypothetical protein SmJEL517_g01418 [Synchytrium microbalum]|uniref:FAD-binding FR-type domain-containing protein n=1 Tax=Synchytrium microbalum TaxID=1806994 RepID=A0A507CDN4_9FUNG|nr:uncharacterized protein SmJEL517_g01418 [Synchytrium microbalum]TPX36156.1 hypothetical protein SmJEL517_g01418 [Synchytrium microbalum]
MSADDAIALFKQRLVEVKARSRRVFDPALAPGVYRRDDAWEIRPCLQPIKPAPDQCCGTGESTQIFLTPSIEFISFVSGCTPCVYDVFRDEVDVYNRNTQTLNDELKRRLVSVEDLGDFVLINKASDDELLSNNAEVVLVAKEYRPFTITEVLRVGSCGLHIVGQVPPDPVLRIERRLNLSASQHLLCRLHAENGESVTRPYTPTTHPHVFGRFDLMVKLYPSGKMSHLLESLKPGSTVDMRGPIDPIDEVTYTPGMARHIILIAGGSGITPFYQILLSIEAKQPIFPTRSTLIYSARTVEDLWLRKDIDTIARRSAGRIAANYVISKHISKHQRIPNLKLPYGQRLTRQTLELLLPAVLDLENESTIRVNEDGVLDYVVMICGPESFNKDVSCWMKELGYERIHKQIHGCNLLAIVDAMPRTRVSFSESMEANGKITEYHENASSSGKFRKNYSVTVSTDSLEYTYTNISHELLMSYLRSDRNRVHLASSSPLEPSSSEPALDPESDDAMVDDDLRPHHDHRPASIVNSTKSESHAAATSSSSPDSKQTPTNNTPQKRKKNSKNQRTDSSDDDPTPVVVNDKKPSQQVMQRKQKRQKTDDSNNSGSAARLVKTEESSSASAVTPVVTPSPFMCAAPTVSMTPAVNPTSTSTFGSASSPPPHKVLKGNDLALLGNDGQDSGRFLELIRQGSQVVSFTQTFGLSVLIVMPSGKIQRFPFVMEDISKYSYAMELYATKPPNSDKLYHTAGATIAGCLSFGGKIVYAEKVSRNVVYIRRGDSAEVETLFDVGTLTFNAIVG